MMVEDGFLKVERKKNGFDEDKETFYAVRGAEKASACTALLTSFGTAHHIHALADEFSNGFRCAT
jgi:hypothetical protein